MLRATVLKRIVRDWKPLRDSLQRTNYFPGANSTYLSAFRSVIFLDSIDNTKLIKFEYVKRLIVCTCASHLVGDQAKWIEGNDGSDLNVRSDRCDQPIREHKSFQSKTRETRRWTNLNQWVRTPALFMSHLTYKGSDLKAETTCLQVSTLSFHVKV